LIALSSSDAKAYEDSLKKDLIGLIDNLKNLHFQVIKADVNVQTRSSETTTSEYVKIESLLSNGVKVDRSSLVDAIFAVRITSD
jgi:hypothetical protein